MGTSESSPKSLSLLLLSQFVLVDGTSPERQEINIRVISPFVNEVYDRLIHFPYDPASDSAARYRICLSEFGSQSVSNDHDEVIVFNQGKLTMKLFRNGTTIHNHFFDKNEPFSFVPPVESSSREVSPPIDRNLSVSNLSALDAQLQISAKGGRSSNEQSIRNGTIQSEARVESAPNHASSSKAASISKVANTSTCNLPRIPFSLDGVSILASLRAIFLGYFC